MKLSKKKLHKTALCKAKKGSGSSLQNLKRKNMTQENFLNMYSGSSMQKLGDPK